MALSINKGWVIQRLAFIAAMYLAVLASIYIVQDDLLFMVKKYKDTPETIGLKGFEEVPLTTPDGQTLYGWYSPAPEGARTVVYFCGNADTLTGSSHLFRGLQQAGYGVFALQYRGYGKSTGEPSEKALFDDAKTVISYVKSKVDERSIIAMGRSLGSGVAVYAAHEFSLAGIVLWSPYTSIENVAQYLYWYLPVKPFGLARHKFDSMARIGGVEEPVLVIYGGLDGTVPPEFSMELYNAVKSPKKAVLYKDSGHNNFNTSKIVADVVEFVKSLN